jgi:hypothetical protein
MPIELLYNEACLPSTAHTGDALVVIHVIYEPCLSFKIESLVVYSFNFHVYDYYTLTKLKLV